MNSRILLVDDDALTLSTYQRALRRVFPAVETARSGAEALDKISRLGPFAVVVVDMRMPEMDGIELLSRIQEAAPRTVRMMLTGSHEVETAAAALREGAIFRFLTKPCSFDALTAELQAGVEHHRVVMAELELLEKTLSGSVKLLISLLSMVDPESFGRAALLHHTVAALIAELHVPMAWEVEMGAMLSPIGIVTLPPGLAARHRAGQPLTGDEATVLQRVPVLGADLIRNIPRLDHVADVVLYQNRGFDGSGFPLEGPLGEALPLGSRILKVASDLLRLEEQGLRRVQALARMAAQPRPYDPRVLSAAAACSGGAVEVAPGTRWLTLSELHVGHVLSADMVTREGRLLLKAETELTEAILARVHNFARILKVREPVPVHWNEEG